MRILFITSGYKGIYDWFESWIHTELIKEHQVTFYTFSQGLKDFETIIQNSKPELALTIVGYKLPKIIIQLLNQYGIKTSLWLTEDPYNLDRSIGLINDFEYLFTIDTAALEYYQKIGIRKLTTCRLLQTPMFLIPKRLKKNSKVIFVSLVTHILTV